MFFVSDNCIKEKFKYSVRAALEKKYSRIVTDTAGTPEAKDFNRVFKGWREDPEGEVIDYLYMRVWWNGYKLEHSILVYQPDWIRQYQAQQTGQ